MNRSELTKQLSVCARIHSSTATRAVDTLLQLIADSLALGEEVNLHDFGRFKAVENRKGEKEIVFRPYTKLREALKQNQEAEQEFTDDLKDACFDIIVNHPGITEEDWVWAVMASCPIEMADAGMTEADLRRWWRHEHYRDSILGWNQVYTAWSVHMDSYLKLVEGKT